MEVQYCWTVLLDVRPTPVAFHAPSLLHAPVRRMRQRTHPSTLASLIVRLRPVSGGVLPQHLRYKYGYSCAPGRPHARCYDRYPSHLANPWPGDSKPTQVRDYSHLVLVQCCNLTSRGLTERGRTSVPGYAERLQCSDEILHLAPRESE